MTASYADSSKKEAYEVFPTIAISVKFKTSSFIVQETIILQRASEDSSSAFPHLHTSMAKRDERLYAGGMSPLA